MEMEVGGTGSWGRKQKWGVEILLGGSQFWAEVLNFGGVMGVL